MPSLRSVPGYANIPEPARREWEQQVLMVMADCLEAGDDSALIQYIHERAKQLLARGFEPEWLQQAIILAEQMTTPLLETVAEGNFVWRAMNRAQAASWQIIADERRRIELTLRESEARYQTIFNSTPIMFWLKDTHNRTLRINRAAAALEGVSPADVEGKSAYDLYPREQAEAFYQDDLTVINSGKPKLGIVEQHTSIGTGKLMWVETGKTPVHNDQGETVGVLVFGVDITERKQAEQALHQSVAQQEQAARYLRATIEAAQELTQVPDLDTLCRRTVELAREKLEIERCGLHLLDVSGRYLLGTYGTDDQGRTTDERGARRIFNEFEDILIASTDQLWAARETPYTYFEGNEEHVVGIGSAVGTVLRGATGPIAILFNDRALSRQPIDQAQQEALAVYCSTIGSIIERKRLEEQVQASLTRRVAQVQTSTEVAQEIASATDLDELFRRVVTLIKDRFNYYHAQIFRFDPAQDAVVLVTGYGEVGQAMLATGHQLPMGRGVVGSAAATGKSILAADVRQDTDWRPNPNLPETRGELAVPIKWRDQVLGILDVQSDRAGALSDDDRLLLEGLCGQIASAIEHRQTEDRLAEERNLIRTLIDTLPDLIYAKDRDSRFILANTATAQRMGADSPLDLIGKSDFDFYPAELAQQYYASEQPITREGQSFIGLEDYVVDAAGQPRWHLSTKVPLRDQAGNISGLVGTTSDITRRKEIELELARSAQLLNTIINTSRDLIYIKDTQGKFLVASQAVARLLGARTADELIGKSDFDFFPYELANKYHTDEQNIIQAGEPLIDIEEPSVYPDGTRIWLLTTKIPYRAADGTLLGLLGIGRDITERKQAEQQMEETLRETERLYAAVSAEGWKTFRQSGQLPEGYRFDRTLLQPAEQIWEPEIQQAVSAEKTITTHRPDRAVAVTPLAVRGAVIGALGVYDNPDQPLQPDDLALLEIVSEQVALALESARLFDQTQRDAERERSINRVTSRIRSARSVEEVLTVATQELRLATQASRSVVDIAPHTATPAASGNGSAAGNQGATV